ncbi:MAG: tetratricopeptide repeat protein [Pseudomonadota bacterium]
MKKAVKYAGIYFSIMLIAFTAAYYKAYEIVPVEEEPVARAIIRLTPAAEPAPTVKSTPSPEPVLVKTGDDYYKEGIAFMRNNRYESAIISFKEAKRLGYDSTKADSLISSAGKKAESQKLASKARQYYSKKDYENAIKVYEKLAKIDVAYKSSEEYSNSYFRLAEKHNALGMQYFNEGRPEQSVKEFGEALKLLEGLKDNVIKYDQAMYIKRYDTYNSNKDLMQEKAQKVKEYLAAADESNKEGVQYFTEDDLYAAKDEFERAISLLEKIKLMVPGYNDSKYTGLLKICSENLESIEAKLSLD